MIMNIDTFVQVVEQWARESLPAIGRVWPLRGGWEEWAQAEIAGYINSIDPSYSVEREVYLFGDDRKADLLINQGASQWAPDWIVVELKCQCPHSPYAFAAGFNKDKTKITELVEPYSSAQKLCLGICVDGRTLEGMGSMGYTIIWIEKEVGLVVYVAR
ncbi:hypothetical protein GVN21_18165 [Caulobacter sp. SLTY]|uniref:hypothetical protein n=1 Tax=Caulobacter sp. SLTY TaxID=2683262 RepID=UPI0014127E31|nr:hypothetical protein [Caulobacter sp. SLTY]NBB17292.1 hypothetical protein [Caulobacter sp. SLTY]